MTLGTVLFFSQSLVLSFCPTLTGPRGAEGRKDGGIRAGLAGRESDCNLAAADRASASSPVGRGYWRYLLQGWL